MRPGKCRCETATKLQVTGIFFLMKYRETQNFINMRNPGQSSQLRTVRYRQVYRLPFCTTKNLQIMKILKYKSNLDNSPLLFLVVWMFLYRWDHLINLCPQTQVPPISSQGLYGCWRLRQCERTAATLSSLCSYSHQLLHRAWRHFPCHLTKNQKGDPIENGTNIGHEPHEDSKLWRPTSEG